MGTDGWQGYGRVLPNEVDHYISKLLTQRLERTNGILRQQTGRIASTTKHERLREESFPPQLSQVWQGVGAFR
jgi:IS1 family transposase